MEGNFSAGIITYPGKILGCVLVLPELSLTLSSTNFILGQCNFNYSALSQSINKSINLFAIKGHRPLTYHTSSTNIHVTTKGKYKIIPVIEIK